MKLIEDGKGGFFAVPETAADVWAVMKLASKPANPQTPLVEAGGKEANERVGNRGGRGNGGYMFTCHEEGCGVRIPAKSRGNHAKWHREHPGVSYGLTHSQKKWGRRAKPFMTRCPQCQTEMLSTALGGHTRFAHPKNRAVVELSHEASSVGEGHPEARSGLAGGE